jgi:hypothetical protein
MAAGLLLQSAELIVHRRMVPINGSCSSETASFVIHFASRGPLETEQD